MSAKGESGLTETSKKDRFVEDKMRDAEEEIRDSNTEHLLVFDKDGNVIWRYDGGEREVNSDEDEQAQREFDRLRKEGKIFAISHNHPTTQIEEGYREGGPFGPDDIAEMRRNGSSFERVVSSDMSYTLRKLQSDAPTRPASRDLFGSKKYEGPWKKDPKNFAKDYNKFVTKAKERAYIMSEERVLQGKIEYSKQAYINHAMKIWIRSSEKWLENHAKDYGYEFHANRRK